LSAKHSSQDEHRYFILGGQLSQFIHEQKGLKIRRNAHNKFCVIELHYTADPAKCTDEWKAEDGINIQLSDSVLSGGKQAMKLDLRADNNPAGVQYTFEKNQDWISSDSDFRVLSLSVKGDRKNRSSRLQMIFDDNDWGSVFFMSVYNNPIIVWV